ncbi:MAG: hypothetical protein ACUVTE_00370 [Candidatus Bathycorpusculaceae bacterium]
MPTLNVPNVSVKVDTTSIVGVKLDVKGGARAVNFDVKAKLEEKERKSQMVVVGFALQLTTKPSIVKFEIEGTATITGKDAEINKMLEIDSETKVPYVFQKVYQNTFTAMYLLSTILNTPPPPIDLLLFRKEEALAENVTLESATVENVEAAEEKLADKSETGT